LVAGGDSLRADESGWQVGLELGRSSLENSFGERHIKRFDDEAGASSVEIGYFFNRYLAVEAGYHDLGSFAGAGSPCPDYVDACIESLAAQPQGLCVEGAPCVEVLAPIEAEVTGWSLAVVPSWPFTERFSAFAKVGAIAWDTDLSSELVVTARGRQFESFSSTDLLAGIGLSYRFGNSLGAVAEYRRLDLDLASTSLGLSWRF
jgi:opacity protein-like surface antigen